MIYSDKMKSAHKIFPIMICMVLILATILAGCGADTSQGDTKAEQEANAEAEFETIKNASVGDIVTFGAYEQDDDQTNGPEAIEWIVLDKTESDAVLLSKYALDARPYNDAADNSSWWWDKCSLREWLNGEFYDCAFTDAEKTNIRLTTVHQDEGTSNKNLRYDTQDYVFLLSAEELAGSFTTAEACQCKATDYAIQNGASVNNNGYVRWWLRSIGDGNCKALDVSPDGVVCSIPVVYAGDAIRPALRVKY